jgi:deoxyribonuclease-4
MAILGAHMSIAGGYYKAAELAGQCHCNCVQIFTKNNNQWRAKQISDEDVERFRTRLGELHLLHPLSHSSYLINLASPDAELWKKSIDAMIIELHRAERLGIPFVVVHPGSFTTSSEQAGINRVARALDEIHAQTRGITAGCLLENTAGQGSNLGWRFEQLAAILDRVQDPDRVGVCFDTCHAFAAGYPMGTEKEYKSTMRQFNRIIGIKRLKAFHLNDSKRELGSRVDRHQHIGHGCLGLEPFRRLLNDLRFRMTPMYLETPKEKLNGEDWDVINLRTLRGLICDGSR